MEAQLLAIADTEYSKGRCRRRGRGQNNFLKGCKWSPDGSCLLTNSDDGVLRIFATPNEIHQRFYVNVSVDAATVEASASNKDEATESACELPAESPVDETVSAIEKCNSAVATESETQAELSNSKPATSAVECNRTPELYAGVRIRLRTQVYDVAWYPSMCYAYRETCCFAAAAFDSPLVLLDAYSGESRATYRAFNQLDELVPLYSVAFDAHGSLLGGTRKTHWLFDVSRPGNDSQQVPRVGAKCVQGGIHSCFAFHNDQSFYAVGSFNQTVGLYSDSARELICPLLNGHRAGVTHVRFSADGNLLWSGARGQDGRVLCWDVRNVDRPVYTAIFPRDVRTNQRCAFDLSSDGKYLIVGNRDGRVAFYSLDDLAKTDGEATFSAESESVETEPQDAEKKPCFEFTAHRDVVNCISSHPHYPQVFASTSGQRHDSAPRRFADAMRKRKATEAGGESESESESSSSDECDASSSDADSIENSLKIWCTAATSVDDSKRDCELTNLQ